MNGEPLDGDLLPCEPGQTYAVNVVMGRNGKVWLDDITVVEQQ